MAGAAAFATSGCRTSPSILGPQDQRVKIQLTNQCAEPLEISAGSLAIDATGSPVGVAMVNVPSVIGGYQVEVPLPPAPTASAAETSRVVIRLRTVPPSWLKPRVQWYEVVGGVAAAYDIKPAVANQPWAEGGQVPLIEARGLPAIRVVPVPAEFGGTDPHWTGSKAK